MRFSLHAPRACAHRVSLTTRKLPALLLIGMLGNAHATILPTIPEPCPFAVPGCSHIGGCPTSWSDCQCVSDTPGWPCPEDHRHPWPEHDPAPCASCRQLPRDPFWPPASFPFDR